MSALSYPGRTLLGDAARGLAGVAVVMFVLIASAPAGWLTAVLGALAVVFSVFTARALLRTRERYGLDADALEVRHRGERLEWAGLERLRLRYYSTRRDHRNGWLEMDLGFDAGHVRVDSRLQGFEPLLARAVAAAREGGVPLARPTVRNLQWLGLIDSGETGIAADG